MHTYIGLHTYKIHVTKTNYVYYTIGVCLSVTYYADQIEKMEELKATRARRGRVYNSVDEFMAERAMVIDLAMSRGQAVKVTVCM